MNIINTSHDFDTRKLKNIIDNNFIGKKTSIYLINGIKLISNIINYKIFEYIVLEGNQIVLWSAIATITQNNDKTIQKLCENNECNSDNNDCHNYLEHFINMNVKVFLCNGIKLQGLLISYIFNQYLIVEKSDIQQLILWGSVATVFQTEISKNTLQISTEKTKKCTILDDLIRKNVVVFLKNGIKLQGMLTSYLYENDIQTLILDENQLINVLHVSTIAPLV